MTLVRSADAPARFSVRARYVPLIIVAVGLVAGWYSFHGASGRSTAVIVESTAHLSFTAALLPSDVDASRMSVVVDVTPNRGMHVYAPGGAQEPVAVRLDPHPLVRVAVPVYPEATPYFFAPAQEQVQVYDKPFRLSVGLEIVRPAGQQSAPRMNSTVSVTGEFSYQACDDQVCYLPVSVPLEWHVHVG